VRQVLVPGTQWRSDVLSLLGRSRA
jgi:hypothetical protein